MPSCHCLLSLPQLLSSRCAITAIRYRSSTLLTTGRSSNLRITLTPKDHLPQFFVSARFFADDNNDDKQKKLTNKVREYPEDARSADDDHDYVPPAGEAADVDADDDPFGVHFDDGTGIGKIGPDDQLPPKYMRDPTTGHFTGTIEEELTDEERRLLRQTDPLEMDEILNRRIARHWDESGTDETGMPAELDRLGERVRRHDMALNEFGRSTAGTGEEEDGDEESAGDLNISKPLTQGELETFREFMKQEMKVSDFSEDDIPTQPGRRRATTRSDDDDDEGHVDPDEKELSLKWLSTRAQRQMDDTVDDDVYADLMPADLSPSRLVNRKNAKRIPFQLLHHNNVELLRRFLTPAGLIKSRVQTRLGLKDQRRVAKMIKRARQLGLIPTQGQFRVEQHGWLHAKDIGQTRDWEERLVERGLVIKESSNKSTERKH